MWRASWHAADGFPNRQVATSLIELVDRVVELFRLGAYVWSTEYRAVETVEEVFLREGLGYNVHPWLQAAMRSRAP